MNEFDEPERLDINKAAESLSRIWTAEMGGKHWYKWCSVAIADREIFLYLDCKKLPPKFEYYGWPVIPMKSTQPKPLKTRKK